MHDNMLAHCYQFDKQQNEIRALQLYAGSINGVWELSWSYIHWLYIIKESEILIDFAENLSKQRKRKNYFIRFPL